VEESLEELVRETPGGTYHRYGGEGKRVSRV
jgi:hypothetical protein